MVHKLSNWTTLSPRLLIRPLFLLFLILLDGFFHHFMEAKTEAQIICRVLYRIILGSGLPRWLSSKESACNAEDTGNMGSIPGSGRSPGGGHGNPLQYSCLENPMDRGVWWAIVHRVTKNWTRLKRLSTAQHSILGSRSGNQIP